MRIFAIALAVSVATAGLVVACSPSGQQDTRLAGGSIDKYGNTVYLSDDDASVQAPFIEKTSTTALSKEIIEMNRTNCGDPTMDEETCSTRIADRELELADRCDDGEQIACDVKLPNGKTIASLNDQESVQNDIANRATCEEDRAKSDPQLVDWCAKVLGKQSS
jgi:hypothetical protein